MFLFLFFILYIYINFLCLGCWNIRYTEPLIFMGTVIGDPVPFSGPKLNKKLTKF